MHTQDVITHIKRVYAPEHTGGAVAMAAASPSLITYEQVENVHATTGLCVCIPTHPFESQRMHRRGYHIFI